MRILSGLRWCWSHLIPATKFDLMQFESIYMSTQIEAAAQVDLLTAKINKIGTETSNTLQKVKDLEAIILAGGDVTPVLQTALDAAVAAAQVADDLTPDVVVEPPPV